MILLSLILACSPDSSVDSAAATEPCPDAPEPALSLPADDAMHEEDVEWWYWTGHLQDDEENEYGFEHVVFVFQVGGVYEATSIHMALTDIGAQDHRFEVLYAHGELPEILTDSFVLEVEDASAIGGNGSDVLVADFEDVSWNLAVENQGAVMLQHGDGYHDYETGGYTYYYTRPRMQVSGSLSVDGETREVTGEAWFDHQYGELTQVSSDGWDWFALQLDDGREIMIFLNSTGSLLHGGSIRDGDCVTEIDPSSLTVQESNEWISEETGCSYPQKWEIQIGEENFVIESLLDDQELPNSYNTYWEGAATVQGDQTGKAYVELAGQCD